MTKTHSRPYTSTDNPYSEAHFKTLKYRPGFPQRFDAIEHARAFFREFFGWYNHQHRHSGIGLMTPATVHYGRAEQTHTQLRLINPPRLRIHTPQALIALAMLSTRRPTVCPPLPAWPPETAEASKISWRTQADDCPKNNARGDHYGARWPRACTAKVLLRLRRSPSDCQTVACVDQ